MAGYPYETGTSYFIPIQATGPGGEPNHSSLCDPIAEVDAGIAPELRRRADDAGIPFSTPETTQGGAGGGARGGSSRGRSDDGAGSSDSGRAAAALVLLCGLVAVVTGGARLIRERRRTVHPAAPG